MWSFIPCIWVWQVAMVIGAFAWQIKSPWILQLLYLSSFQPFGDIRYGLTMPTSSSLCMASLYKTQVSSVAFALDVETFLCISQVLNALKVWIIRLLWKEPSITMFGMSKYQRADTFYSLIYRLRGLTPFEIDGPNNPLLDSCGW